MRILGLAAPALALVLLLSFPTNGVFAHGGGLDSYGGHNDRKRGNYHFHRGPLAGKSFASKTDAMAALESSRRRSPDSARVRVATVPESSPQLDALIRLLVAKGVITEAELKSEVARSSR
jgi:hypothetical protein